MDVSAEAKQLARDLDKFPSGEQIVERLLNAQIALQRKNAELAAELDRNRKEVVESAKDSSISIGGRGPPSAIASR
jgi:hypothetical protein